MKVLVTGSAGFIGFHLVLKLINEGFEVLGIDNINNYYDTNLKNSRIKILKSFKNFSFKKIDLTDEKKLSDAFVKFKPSRVANLAAQPGVRYSLKKPHEYIQSNIVGFMNVIELCKNMKIDGLIYASSSSVYGGNKTVPFKVGDFVDTPISLYGATKKTNELIAHSYSHLYDLPTTGLRYFTVYGPWYRPDMAIFIFTKKIINDEPISLFNNGNMFRDFTFVDDIVSGTLAAIKKNYKCEIFNLGNNKSENLMKVIRLIEKEVGKKAVIKYKPLQPGDPEKTFANINKSKTMLGYSPKISLEDGIPIFYKWFKEYYNV